MGVKLKYKINTSDEFSIRELIARIRSKLKYGLDYTVFVCDAKQQRSLQQNAYYWGVVNKLLSAECGYRPDELHEALLHKFAPRIDVRIKGEHHSIPKRSKKFTTKEFAEFIDATAQMAAEMGVYIPDANQIPDEYAIQHL